MNTQHPNPYPEERQFRLVKFFAYASFIVLIIFSFPFSVIIGQKAKDILMRSYENYALLVGQNLNHQVFQNFSVPVYRRFGEIKLRDRQQYEWMDRVVKATIHSFKVDRVNIYDINKGVIAYSTDPNLLGDPAQQTIGYKNAVEGKTVSTLLSTDDDFLGLDIKWWDVEKKLRTYIPFQGVDPFTGDKGLVLGVFELIQDLSDEYQSIVNFQYFVLGVSVLIMGLIFLALLLIVHEAEKILEERAKEQRELQSQLNQTERLAALGEMCAGVSHEIRNPLGIIRSTAELLSSMPDSQEPQKKLSNVIIEESSRLNDIVTEFLDFARPQEPNFQECDLEEIIRKILNFLGPELQKQHITTHDNLDGRSLKITGDPHLLYRSFLNLFMNAIQSMKNGGTMITHVREEADQYVVDIRDTGGGISPENLQKVFNPFFSTKDKGSGLGLPIVRNIIEGHRGSIRIESQEGSGTKVIVTLPKTG